jgi:hypothetical protein
MTSSAIVPTVRRLLVASALLFGSAVLAHAGNGTCYEDCTRGRTTVSTAATSGHTATRLTPEDSPGLPVASSPTSSARAGSLAPATLPHASTPPLPASPDHRSEKRERGRAPVGTTVNSHRPATQRSKGAVRNTPATPGMGMLLRMGASAGREISMITDVRPQSDLGCQRGRAPPRGDHTSNLEPALPPFGSPLAATPARHPLTAGAPELPIRHRLIAAAPPSPGACACAAFVANGPDALPMERLARSCAVRLKGAAARSFLPFGGFTA